MQLIAFITVLLSSAYLMLLGVSAFARPDVARRFLGGFAQSLPVHALELSLRIVAGIALVARAPRMHFSQPFSAFGWALIGTSVVLAVLSWRLHQRFAEWAIPQISGQLPLIGVTSVLGGLVLLGALVLPGVPPQGGFGN